MRYTKTFKKYRAECRPEVLTSVRDYVADHQEYQLHEDESIIKVTASAEAIETMVTALTAQHGGLYNETADSDGDAGSAD